MPHISKNKFIHVTYEHIRDELRLVTTVRVRVNEAMVQLLQGYVQRRAILETVQRMFHGRIIL